MSSNPAVIAAQKAEVERKRAARQRYKNHHYARVYKAVHTTACGHGNVEVLEPGMADPYRISVDEYNPYAAAREFLPGTIVTIRGQSVMF